MPLQGSGGAKKLTLCCLNVVVTEIVLLELVGNDWYLSAAESSCEAF